MGVDLYEILMTIQEHPFLEDVLGIQEHFWNMFVVDALLGNPDRNNSNWGIILSRGGVKRIAPVYDNGNCLNCKWDEEKMLEVLLDEKKLETESYKGRRCIFEQKGKKDKPVSRHAEHGISGMYGGCEKNRSCNRRSFAGNLWSDMGYSRFIRCTEEVLLCSHAVQI